MPPTQTMQMKTTRGPRQVESTFILSGLFTNHVYMQNTRGSTWWNIFEPMALDAHSNFESVFRHCFDRLVVWAGYSETVPDLVT